MRKTAFVTGGAGFLGVHLVSQLVAAGWKVLVFDRDAPEATQLEKLGIPILRGDITDPASCQEAMPAQVDAVFHLAANTSHWKLANSVQTRVNVEGTRTVVSTALARNAGRFIHTSSTAAYGFHTGQITEQTPSRALGSSINYFRTKRKAELEIERGIREGLDAVILNPANIIGSFDRSGWSRFFTLIDQGQLPGVPPGRASFCHVAEVARAHLAAYERGRCGERYLLGGADASFLEVVQQIGEMMGRPTPAGSTPAFLSKAAAQLYLWRSYLTRQEPHLTPEKAALLSGELICSSEKAERELGYRAVALSAMLEDCYQWMCAEELLGRSGSSKPPSQPY
jgi:nucleoside-diphosphate-sugar epimerase